MLAHSFPLLATVTTITLPLNQTKKKYFNTQPCPHFPFPLLAIVSLSLPSLSLPSIKLEKGFLKAYQTAGNLIDKSRTEDKLTK
jgi:hypothetical protein